MTPLAAKAPIVLALTLYAAGVYYVYRRHPDRVVRFPGNSFAIVVALIAGVGGFLWAGENSPPSNGPQMSAIPSAAEFHAGHADNAKVIAEAWRKRLPNTPIHSVEGTGFAGLIKINTPTGAFYGAESGHFLIVGGLIDLQTGEVIDLTANIANPSPTTAASTGQLTTDKGTTP